MWKIQIKSDECPFCRATIEDSHRVYVCVHPVCKVRLCQESYCPVKMEE